MTEYVYSDAPTRLPNILEKIRSVGVPDKATTRWLEVIGFKTKADRSALKVFKFIGLTNENGQPTEVWQQYRGANHANVLGDCIKQGYAELFAIFPKANELEQSELESFFAQKTKGGSQVISRLVRTFLALCSAAVFVSNSSAVPLEHQTETTPEKPTPKKKEPAPQKEPLLPGEEFSGQFLNTMSPNLHIDIQIHISPDASSDQIDQIFASMAKHLYGK